MTITFFWNYLNHHQVLVADEMYKLLGDDFHFVSTLPRDEKELKGGKDYSDRPYCILAAHSDEAHEQALMLAKNSDVCVFGACSQEYAIERAKQKHCGLSFECGERWLKRGWLNVLSPVLRNWWKNYRKYYRHKPFYKLCASAFVAKDDGKLGCYKGRHYKWGYFSQVPESIGHSNDDIAELSSEKKVRLMWCARFIDWKRPELAILLAERLKRDGCEFILDMYGEGSLRASMENKVNDLGLTDVVKFHGSVPNDEIRRAMSNADIFLFTSDKQEGWGVVANEAMACGCCLVGSDEIGAIPYLVQDGVDGLLFKSKNIDSLYQKVKLLVDDYKMRERLSFKGRTSMQNLWNARHAAESFLQLVDDLQNGRDVSINEGPCSKA